MNQRVNKLSKVLMIVLSIICVITLAGGIFMLISSVGMMFLPKMADTINPYFHGAIRIEGGTLIVNGASSQIWQTSVAATLVTLKLFALCAAAFMGRHICKRIKSGETPFQRSVGKEIRYISLFIFIYQMIFSWEGDILDMLVVAVIPLIVLCISYLFDYGYNLQHEVDELL